MTVSHCLCTDHLKVTMTVFTWGSSVLPQTEHDNLKDTKEAFSWAAAGLQSPAGQAGAATPTHSAFLDPLVRAVEEEGAEQGDAGAVVQDGQVHFRELEGCWVLFQQLPNAVKEHQEQRRLGKETRNYQI